MPGARAAVSGDDHLHVLYGSRAAEVLRLIEENPRLGERLAPDYPDIAAQVVFAVREEQCVNPDDFIFRRTLLGFSRDQGVGRPRSGGAMDPSRNGTMKSEWG